MGNGDTLGNAPKGRQAALAWGPPQALLLSYGMLPPPAHEQHSHSLDGTKEIHPSEHRGRLSLCKPRGPGSRVPLLAARTQCGQCSRAVPASHSAQPRASPAPGPGQPLPKPLHNPT